MDRTGKGETERVREKPSKTNNCSSFAFNKLHDIYYFIENSTNYIQNIEWHWENYSVFHLYYVFRVLSICGHVVFFYYFLRANSKHSETNVFFFVYYPLFVDLVEL